ncbi:hypothetical protein A5692_02700 [Mycobacterium sp. E342]|nr:hypothetical protein A9X04_27180 [Mycobacterium sp. E3247]OBH25306.1 hypothetical protein A5692_02700 [Mycobacterium sp. E342]
MLLGRLPVQQTQLAYFSVDVAALLRLLDRRHKGGFEERARGVAELIAFGLEALAFHLTSIGARHRMVAGVIGD